MTTSDEKIGDRASGLLRVPVAVHCWASVSFEGSITPESIDALIAYLTVTRGVMALDHAKPPRFLVAQPTSAPREPELEPEAAPADVTEPAVPEETEAGFEDRAEAGARIVDFAMRAWLKLGARPVRVDELLEPMIADGWQTTSQQPEAVVRLALHKSRGLFTKVGDGKWTFAGLVHGRSARERAGPLGTSEGE